MMTKIIWTLWSKWRKAIDKRGQLTDSIFLSATGGCWTSEAGRVEEGGERESAFFVPGPEGGSECRRKMTGKVSKAEMRR